MRDDMGEILELLIGLFQLADEVGLSLLSSFAFGDLVIETLDRCSGVSDLFSHPVESRSQLSDLISPRQFDSAIELASPESGDSLYELLYRVQNAVFAQDEDDDAGQKHGDRPCRCRSCD